MPSTNIYRGQPTRAFPYKIDHALFAFEPLLKFANTPVTDRNFAQLVMPGASYAQREALLFAKIGGTSIGGRPLVQDITTRGSSTPPGRPKNASADYVLTFDSMVAQEHFPGFVHVDPEGSVLFREDLAASGATASVNEGIVKQLQAKVRRALHRCLTGVHDPVVDPCTGANDFVIAGREPFIDARGYVDAEGKDVVYTRDLQDYWCRMVRLLNERLRHGGGSLVQTGLPFRPLAQCRVWTRIRLQHRRSVTVADRHYCDRFYFCKKPRQKTCGQRQCIERHKYLVRKGDWQDSH